MLWSLESWTRNLKSPAEIVLCLENSCDVKRAISHQQPQSGFFSLESVLCWYPFKTDTLCDSWIGFLRMFWCPRHPLTHRASLCMLLMELTLHVPIDRKRGKESTLKLEKLHMSSSLVGKEGVVCIHWVIMMAVFVFLIIRCSRNTFESKQVKRGRHFLALAT